jgi:hypothetical protein
MNRDGAYRGAPSIAAIAAFYRFDSLAKSSGGTRRIKKLDYRVRKSSKISG